MPVPVVDSRTGEVLDTSSSEAQRAVLQGEALLPEGREVLVARGNETGTVDPSQVGAALANNWRIVDAGEAAAVDLKREESTASAQALALGESALSGATVGLSDVALAGMGIADPKRMRARREAAGGLATAAELVGATAPLLLSGGSTAGLQGAGTAARLGAAGRAARAVGTPVRALEGLGALAERGTARLLGEGGGLMRQALPAVAREGVTGFGYGVGGEVRESVLGERELSAERLLSAGITNSLMGAGFAAAIPAVGIGGKKLTGSMTARLEESLNKMSGSAGGSTGVGLLAKAMSMSGHVTEEKMAKSLNLLRSKHGTGLLNDVFYNTEAVRRKSAESILSASQEARSALSDALKATQGVQKFRRIEKLVDSTAGDVAPTMASSQIDDAFYRVLHASDENAESAFGSYIKNDLRDASAVLLRAERELQEAAKASSGGARAAGAFRAVDRAKQDIDHIIRSRGGIDNKAADTRKLLRDVNKGLRSHLEDEAVWGKAASLQKEMNAASSASMRAVEELGTPNSILGKILNTKSKTDLDIGNAMTLAKRYGSARGEADFRKAFTALDAQMEYLQAAKRNYDLAPESLQKIERAERAVDGMRKQLERQAEVADVTDLVSALREGEGLGSPSIHMLTTAGPSIGAALGSAFGPVGTAVGALAGKITQPYTALRSMASVADLVHNQEGSIRKALSGFTKKLRGGPKGQGAKKVAASSGHARDALRPSRVATMVAGSRPGKEQDDTIKKAQAYASNPELVQQKLTRDLFNLENIAPALASSVLAGATRAMSYLAETAPKPYKPPYGGKPIVSSLEAISYARRIETVMDLPRTIARLADGTLTKEHADTLKAVWPETYADIQAEINATMLDMGANEKPVPYGPRLQLGILFGVPTDESLTPEGQRAIAQSIGSAQQDASAGAPPQPSGGGRVKTTHDIEAAKRLAMAPNERPGEGRE